jgi:hypothetical protein
VKPVKSGSESYRARRDAAHVDVRGWSEEIDELRKEADELGYLGLGREFLFGISGKLSLVIARLCDVRIEIIQREADARAAELRGEIDAAAPRAEQDFEESRRHDLKAHGLREELGQVRATTADVERQEQDLPPERRSDGWEGREVAVAITGTAAMDAVTFLFTLIGLAGPLWLRILLALVITAAYTGVVAAGGRSLAWLWGRTSTNRPLAVSAALVVVAALAALAGVSFAAMADFRQDVFPNAEKGLPTDPQFLLFTQSASALGATISIAWWHRLRPAHWLRKQIAELRERAAKLVAEIEKEEQAARDAGARAQGFVIEAEEAMEKLDALDEETAHRVAEERFRAAAVKHDIEIWWEKGRRRREREAPTITVSAEVRAEAKRRLDALMRRARRRGGHDHERRVRR